MADGVSGPCIRACATCLWWDHDVNHGYDRRACHLNPPHTTVVSVAGGVLDVSQYPKTNKDDWCSHWEVGPNDR